jgi:hypothetical protein
MKVFRVLTTAILRFVRIFRQYAEFQKIDKMPAVPAATYVIHPGSVPDNSRYVVADKWGK